MRPSWLIGVAVVILAFVALGAVLRLTHNTYQDVQAVSRQVPSSFIAPALVLDLKAPLRPVVTGSFTYAGSSGPFVQPFLGAFDFEGTCDSYVKGAAGRFQTPYAVYPKGAKLRSFSARMTVPAYKGPGSYSATQIEGDITARDAFGTSQGGVSSGTRATFLLQTRPDGSGSLTFTGPDAIAPNSTQVVSGVMSWTCQDQRIDLNAYTLTPY